MSVSCAICLSSLNLKDDTVHTTSCGHIFHLNCLTQALRMSSYSCCPQCRRPNIQHFQLFFVSGNDDIDDEAGASFRSSDTNTTFLSRQIGEISRKLDSLTATVTTSRRDSSDNSRGGAGREEVRMYRNLVDQLQRENEDLKEILEMEKILSSSSEREIEQLKLEIRERNDLINALQIQNDTLRDETDLYEAASAKVPTVNLVDL